MPRPPETILHIGLGGAGQRHLRLIRQVLGDGLRHLAWRQTHTTPTLTASFEIDEGVSLEEKYGIELMPDLRSAIAEKPDLAVIATPTALHLAPAEALAAAGVSMVIEKPLSHNMHGVPALLSQIRDGGQKFGMVFQRRRHPLIAKARALIAEGRLGPIVSAAFDVSSFVPAWHAYEDFRQLYAVREDLGGGVLLTEIHEIDLCQWMFGIPKTVFCAAGNRGFCPLDVEDTALLTLDYGAFAAALDLSFMRKPVGRGFRIDGADATLIWRDSPDQLSLIDADGRIEVTSPAPGFSGEQPFYEFWDDFFNNSGRKSTTDSLDAALNAQVVVDAARRSMESGQSVSISQAGS